MPKNYPSFRSIYEYENGEKRIRLTRSDGRRMELRLNKDETKARRVCYSDNQKRFPVIL